MRAVVFGILACLLNLYAAESPLEHLVEQIRKSNAVECRLRSSSGDQYYLVATRNGKYRFEGADRIIVSNGTVVWNYAPSQKTVTIARVPPTGSGTLDRIVFEVLERYRAEHRRDRVVLRPSGEPLYGVQRIVLDFRGRLLQGLTVEYSTHREQWRIRSLRFDPPLASERFEFSVPPGVEVVDLR